MKYPLCPRCENHHVVKSGVVNERQRYCCKKCNYYFSVDKIGKSIDSYYVTKALQLYIEGISYREIERILGVSHVSVMNWVRKYKVKAPEQRQYHPTYKILNHTELLEHLRKSDNLKGAGTIITELGDKYMMIKWKRFKE
ncbi:helix-turn-helix domain-containing protein [Pontibacter silvestris]|uniref:Helix-turn-helix domain-containing protein n=1 Tax=Pontibacter silvestris TaxID=2305183 RepID=A0ABW4WZW8_9BACT|nr:helix-turn-helix domain-containing protein [Pontibacter silvestris]MCC9138738.1 helix-turn-helix domain-containing protein [Pontibacter silvestris]